MDELPDTAALAAFTRTVDAGSLSRASKELGVPRATLGRRLSRLEDQLGTRLLRRTTRSITLTEAGRTLYSQAKAALDAMRDAVASVRTSSGAIRGPLRVSVPPFPGSSFGELITSFLAKYPDVQLDLHTSTQAVHFGEHGFDVALRASAQLDPGLVRKPIAESRLIAVASPAYLARAGTPRTAQELASHACLRGYARGESASHEWPLVAGGAVRITGPLATNDIQLARDAAIAGLGIAVLPDLVVGEHIAAGALVHVLAGIVGATSTIAVVFPERRLMTPVVRVFVDEIVAWGKRELPQCPEEAKLGPLSIPESTKAIPKSTKAISKSTKAKRARTK